MDARQVALRTLAIDTVAAEVVEALDAAGIPAILLKGAVIARWLYDDGTVRAYGDVDLLVAPRRHAPAEAVLAGLGFRCVSPPVPPESRGHARVWARRPGEPTVDLHHTLWGVAPDRAWEVLSARTEEATVAGTTVRVLDEPARALHLALHAAQHGRRVDKPSDDLRRGVERLDPATWQEAASLGGELDATTAMGAGLRLVPGGERLATGLGLPGADSVELVLRTGEHTAGALSFDRLVRARGVGRKAAFALRTAVPHPGVLRRRYPWAGRGRGHLALAYLWRLAAVIGGLPAAAARWARARRAL